MRPIVDASLLRGMCLGNLLAPDSHAALRVTVAFSERIHAGWLHMNLLHAGKLLRVLGVRGSVA